MGVYLLAKTYPTTPKKSVLYQQPPKILPILPAQCKCLSLGKTDEGDVIEIDEDEREGTRIASARPCGSL